MMGDSPASHEGADAVVDDVKVYVVMGYVADRDYEDRTDIMAVFTDKADAQEYTRKIMRLVSTVWGHIDTTPTPLNPRC